MLGKNKNFSKFYPKAPKNLFLKLRIQESKSLPTSQRWFLMQYYEKLHAKELQNSDFRKSYKDKNYWILLQKEENIGQIFKNWKHLLVRNIYSTKKNPGPDGVFGAFY